MTEPQTVPTQAEPEQEKASRWEDYIDVFFSPFELFRRRAQDKVGPPLLTLIGLGMIFYLVLIPANQMVIRASMPPEQQAQLTEGMIKAMSWGGVVGVPIMYTLMILAAAFLLWLGGKIADVRTEFSRTMLIATYASFVMLLAQIAGGVLVLVMGESGFDVYRSMSFGPLRFIGSADMDKILAALLQRLDLFAIWQAALWAIGLSVIYRISMAKAGAIAAATWLLFALPTVVMAALGVGPGSS